MRAWQLQAILERVPGDTLVTLGQLGSAGPKRHVVEVRRMHGQSPSQLVLFTSISAPDHRGPEPHWWLAGPPVRDVDGLEALLDPEVPAELRGGR